MPEMYEVTCPHCERVYRLSRDKIERNAGREIRCRACNNPFLLPGVDAAEGEPPPFVPPTIVQTAPPESTGARAMESARPATETARVKGASEVVPSGPEATGDVVDWRAAAAQPVASEPTSTFSDDAAGDSFPAADATAARGRPAGVSEAAAAEVATPEPERPASGETVIETEVEPAIPSPVIAEAFSRKMLGSPAPIHTGDVSNDAAPLREPAARDPLPREAIGREATRDSADRERAARPRPRLDPPTPPPVPVYAMSRQTERDIAILRGWVRFWSVLVLTLMLLVMVAAGAVAAVWYFELPVSLPWLPKR